jgi:CRISPR/Cas system-associated exonuclease Cas4 (RecB family)
MAFFIGVIMSNEPKSRTELVAENDRLRVALFKIADEINEVIKDINLSDCSGCLHENYQVGASKVCSDCINGSNREVE